MYRLTQQSMGAFLCPPGHPAHTYGVHSRDASMSIENALEDSDVPETLKARIRKLLESAELVESEAWVSMVYGYFRNSYSPDGVERNVSAAFTARPGELPDEHHLGYLCVRKFFPDHTVRADLIRNGGSYGSKTCTRCGVTCQYDAKIDAFAPFEGRATCDAEGTQPHVVA